MTPNPKGIEEDLRLLRMGPQGDKGWVIEVTGRTVAAIAGQMAAWLNAHDAVNYTETEFTHYETPFTITVQRNDGQTPHQLRRKAEAEVERLQNQIRQAIDMLETGKPSDPDLIQSVISVLRS